MERESQTIPVRIYQTPNRILLAAPLPGLEPDDISVSIADSFVTISGKERGPRQHERDLSVSEWRIGPYFREIDLRSTGQWTADECDLRQRRVGVSDAES